MRLALVGPVYPYRGGIAHYTTMLYRALRYRGHEVLVVSFKRQYPQWLFPGQSDKDPSEEPLKVKDAQYWIDSLNPITWLTTFRRIRDYRPDVIVLQWWTTFWAPLLFLLGALNRIFLRSSLVYICHNVLPHETRFWDSLLARLAWRWGKSFIVQSEEEKERLSSIMHDIPVSVVPHPIYDMFADQKIPQKEARKRLDLPLDRPILLFFGFVREYKGLKDLLAALPEIRAQLGEVTLVVAGEFWEDKSPYLEMIENLRITDAVIVEDRYIPNEEVSVYFSAVDVLVAPYRRATGSGIVQMALGCECPVITTQAGNSANAVQSGINGLVTPTADSQAIGKAIVKYFHNRPNQSKESEEKKRLYQWDALVLSIEVVTARCE